LPRTLRRVPHESETAIGHAALAPHGSTTGPPVSGSCCIQRRRRDLIGKPKRPLPARRSRAIPPNNRDLSEAMSWTIFAEPLSGASWTLIAAIAPCGNPMRHPIKMALRRNRLEIDGRISDASELFLTANHTVLFHAGAITAANGSARLRTRG